MLTNLSKYLLKPRPVTYEVACKLQTSVVFKKDFDKSKHGLFLVKRALNPNLMSVELHKLILRNIASNILCLF